MPHSPVIGLAMLTPDPAPGKSAPCWVMGQRYARVLAGAGGVPWVVPLLTGDERALRAIYERLDGVFLAGGSDVDPSAYGEERHALCGRSDLARDWTELTLVRWALADHKPVLGVCRGLQLLNVACGGSLYQHVPAQHPGAIKHDYCPTAGHARDYLAHGVRAEAGSRLGRLLGHAPVAVNSMHHQAVRRLAPGLRVTARAPDGLVEGVEGGNGHYLVGVQWHPEELVGGDAAHRRLFIDFVEAARAAAPA